VSQSVDLPPPRRPLFFPVVIATVFLSIIGMSAGLVLGSRHHPRGQADNQGSSYVPTEQSDDSPDATDCPEQMRATARRLGYDVALTEVLRVRVPSTGTTVWICEDVGGRLFYQANKGGPTARWVEGETALFLPGVVRGEDDYHAKAADGNTFSVNKERLQITFRNGETQSQEVVPE
jgi:hypothetical protein